MSFPPFLVLAISVWTVAPPLPRGNEDFRLGMSRAQVDSAVTARALTVVSSGSAYLVCASDDPAVEYEQYSFFRAPHGMVFLWKVTIGYRLGATREDLDSLLVVMRKSLGDPASDTGAGATETGTGIGSPPPPPGARQVIWADRSTAVQAGARWSDEAPGPADRMMVTWVDRRLQRLVEARARSARAGQGD